MDGRTGEVLIDSGAPLVGGIPSGGANGNPPHPPELSGPGSPRLCGITGPCGLIAVEGGGEQRICCGTGGRFLAFRSPAFVFLYWGGPWILWLPGCTALPCSQQRVTPLNGDIAMLAGTCSLSEPHFQQHWTAAPEILDSCPCSSLLWPPVTWHHGCDCWTVHITGM